MFQLSSVEIALIVSHDENIPGSSTLVKTMTIIENNERGLEIDFLFKCTEIH